MRIIDCCRNCETRYLGCHDKCSIYKAQRAEQDAIEKKRRDSNDIEYQFIGMNLRRREQKRKHDKR